MVFQSIAICLLFIFYACYFIKMLMQKKKGIQTDHIGKGKTGYVKIIEIVMKIASIAVPITELISILLNTGNLPAGFRIAGIIIAAFGDGFFVVAVLTMRDSWRAGVSENERTELVTDGIFKISRNPAFLGFNLVYIGILCMFFNPVLLIISLCAIVSFHLQIVFVEEIFLVKVFGQDYINYKNTVRRYLGRK